MKIKYLYDRLNTISESDFFNNFYKVSKGTQYFVDSVTHELRERERERVVNLRFPKRMMLCTSYLNFNMAAAGPSSSKVTSFIYYISSTVGIKL